MRLNKNRNWKLGLLALSALSVFAWQTSVDAQSGSRNSPSGSGRTRSTYQSGTQYGAGQGTGSVTRTVERTYEDKFWDWLKSSKFRNWAPAPGQGLEAYPGQSPHGAFLKMYMNRSAAAFPGKPPHGSVIVKENYTEDGKTLAALTVMYRVKGYDPDNGDWYYMKFNGDGTVATANGVRLGGKVKSCIDCHAGAGGGDFVFFNDEMAAGSGMKGSGTKGSGTKSSGTKPATAPAESGAQ